MTWSRAWPCSPATRKDSGGNALPVLCYFANPATAPARRGEVPAVAPRSSGHGDLTADRHVLVLPVLWPPGPVQASFCAEPVASQLRFFVRECQKGTTEEGNPGLS